jgi:hypothetical protein
VKIIRRAFFHSQKLTIKSGRSATPFTKKLTAKTSYSASQLSLTGKEIKKTQTPR